MSDSGGGSCHSAHAEWGSTMGNSREALHRCFHLWSKGGEGIQGAEKNVNPHELCLSSPERE